MSVFDSIFAGEGGLASSLLNAFGVSGVQYIKKTSQYNARTDTIEETVEQRVTTTTPPLNYKSYELSDSTIEVGDCKIIGRGSDYYDVVDKQDRILINNTYYIIISHKHVYSGNDIALTIMQVRKQVDSE